MKIERKQIYFYVAFSLPSPVPIRGSYGNDDGDGNENDKKMVGKLTITLLVHHAFLYISLPSLPD